MAAEAFGTMAEDGNLKFIESLTSVGDTYSNVSGKAQEMFNNTTTSQQELDSALRTAEERLAPIGDKIAEVGADLIPELTDGFLEFADFVEQNGSAIISVIAGIGAAFIAWNVATIIQSVTTAISAFRAANEGATIAQWP